jgi:hypothetical protein
MRISIYIDKELHKRMKKYPDANWSEMAQDAFKQYINGHEEYAFHPLELTTKADKIVEEMQSIFNLKMRR